jgi:diguanylate cyclase (GGDEF)-like protein/PAS domain S-box-containing protein
MQGARAGSGRTAGAGLTLLLRAHKGATIAFVVVLIAALFAALTVRVLIVKKGSIEKRVELLISNFVGAIDGQISASIDKIDLVVLALADELQEQLLSRKQIDVKSVAAIIARYLSRIPELNGLRVTDAAGIVIAATGLPASARVSFADRDFFQAQRASLTSELIVSQPMLGRVSEGWITVLSRKYVNPDGSFAGLIAAPIRIAHLTKLLSVLDLGPGGVAVIRDRDLALVTRYPPNAGPAGVMGSKGASKELTDLVNSGSPQGTYHSAATADGIERTSAYHVLARTPFVLQAGVSSDYYLADWRADVRKGIVLNAVFSGVLSLCGLLLWWMWRQQAREGALATSVLDNAAEGIMVGSADGRILSVNQAFTDITGYAAEEALGQLPSLLKSQENDQDLDSAVAEEIGAKGRWQGQVWKRRKDGGTFLALETISPVRNEFGQIVSYVIVFTDITELHRKDERIRHLAFHDALTGLPNRVLLQQRVEQAFDRARVDAAPFALLLIDLDRFKLVNDMLGHRAGDNLLRQVAERLRQCTQDVDTIARVGGDEFVILQPDIGGSEDPERLATQALRLLAAPYDISGTQVAVGGSIGVALAPRDGMNFDELFGHSDLALYRAKSEGRNHFRFFDPEMGRAAMERGMLELDLREAVERGQFDVYYQPCIDLVSGEIVCCEALIRWHHPVRGLINPAEFIPIAEDIGLIGRIGDWVLNRACEQAASWPRQVKTAVNLSAAQFIAGDLFEAVQKALARSRLAPERLELEITESLLIDDNDGSLATLHRLREHGVRIALDDFGTGYSSLTYLRQFPFDRIKIDKGFVAEITTRPDCAAIVSAVAGLGRSLGISITAEGIETRDQLVMVRAAGCTEAQGFLFGRPVPATDMVRILATRAPENIRGLWAELSERSAGEPTAPARAAENLIAVQPQTRRA